MTKTLCYLAGPITGYSYGEVTDWRAFVAEHLDDSIAALSPMRHKEYLLQETSIGDSYDKTLMSTQRAITVRDRFDTTRADMIIVNLLGATRVSIGTMIELGWADANNIPIVIVMEKEDNLHDHAMVREIAGWIVDNLDDAVCVVNTTLVPGI